MNITLNLIEKFLLKVDNLFPIPLSNKCELKLLARKFAEKATICAHLIDNEIVALVAGYTNDSVGKIGYISIVATLSEEQGKGYASKLIRQFLDIAEQKNLEAVHLYADRRNASALTIYRRLGFVEWKMPDDPRESDLHLIFEFSKENQI